MNLGETITFEWLNKPWSILSYKEASDIIIQNKKQFKTCITPNEGFSKEQELFLVNHCKCPVFIVDWPANQKPFYMKQSREDASLVHALDLLMPTIGELCGGSLRESDEQILRNHPKLPQGLEWYLELRKFGGLHTGGFGMGFERYLQLLTGIKI
ncbi:Probable asparagine--tRNA ligase, mitochondrial [Eumeta japonica]|uniref:Probable asparagine--tRNA ligase, mitochondrial n=1 Tax=Eumeta variegata TaxID=151549 RepID=A0A4C1SK09_EUMVA|nr:Probable asparagine--tRNA ligase, mitochondrial [Eumeta japonica]